MKEMLVLDLDRTLVNSDEMFDRLCEATGQMNPDLADELIDYNTKRTSRGKNREMFRPGEILKHNKQKVFDTFVEVVADSDKNYLYDDAERLLSRTQRIGQAALLLTYGDQEWQEPKINATLSVKGYNMPVIYTEEKEKSKVISEFWSDEDQAYKFGPETATKIVGVGDEITDFVGYENLPNARGYLISRKENTEPIELPDNVVQIRSLDEIVLSE